jgi:SAM-dependent methyltransferase
MNKLENWFCATNFWRGITQKRLLPWMLDGSELGSRVLELGAGPGAATSALLQRFYSVTSLEYSSAFIARIARDSRSGNSSTPFAGKESRVSPEKVWGGEAKQRVARIAEGSAARAVHGNTLQVVQGDATQLPFAEGSFSCAIAILMLHHLRSAELQDSALAEIRRVLQPGGILLAFEIHNGWLQRLAHTHSTFVPFAASAANARLNASGFSRVSVDFRPGGFLLRAQRGVE